MNFSTIKKYFNFIQSHANEGAFFYNINRYYKDTVGHPIMLHEYPYDSNWDVVYSDSAWRQPWIHSLITQYKRNYFNNNIQKELKRIKVIGNQYCNSKSYQTIWPNKYRDFVYRSVNTILLGIPKKICKACNKIIG